MARIAEGAIITGRPFVRTRRQAAGDQRINPFGVGGEIEVRSGLLVQKQPITGPQLHFGLGEQTSVDVARIVWPNGSVRAEFDLKADQQIVTEQRLKGSCPFLFAFDGKQMRFVKDAVPWSSAIGLRINNIGTARIAATEEWYKIPADQLVPHDGFYDLRITAELWETYYYDYLALMTVDHPAGTEIFVDERFVIPPAKLAITTVETPHEIAHAVDDEGHGMYRNRCATSTANTWTILRAANIRASRAIIMWKSTSATMRRRAARCISSRKAGCIRPILRSMSLSRRAITKARTGLSLEVPDGRGGWVVARPNLGFPAGRKKICLIDLTNIFRPGTPRKVRLRTNLEIYWDQIQWARGAPTSPSKTTRLMPAMRICTIADIPPFKQANPIFARIARLRSSGRFQTKLARSVGLLHTITAMCASCSISVDDRYIIMNAGDEMSCDFAEQPAPPAGWVRDYVIVGDGWIKDGDYNSTFSKTVLPLPYHAKNRNI